MACSDWRVFAPASSTLLQWKWPRKRACLADAITRFAVIARLENNYQWILDCPAKAGQ
jgi:hypothetical protein